jgi:hypothetical protein
MGLATVIEGTDYRPLAALVGVWQGDKGADRAPEPDGEERKPDYATISFEAAEFEIVQARKRMFSHTVLVRGDTMTYSESTLLYIYDKKSFDHSDVNTLRRVG